MITHSQMVVPVSFCSENVQVTECALLDSWNFIDTNFAAKQQISLESLPTPLRV